MNNLFNLNPPVVPYLSDVEIKRFLENIMKPVLRMKAHHVDKTICGLTLEDIERLSVKKEFKKDFTEILKEYEPNNSTEDSSEDKIKESDD